MMTICSRLLRPGQRCASLVPGPQDAENQEGRARMQAKALNYNIFCFSRRPGPKEGGQILYAILFEQEQSLLPTFLINFPHPRWSRSLRHLRRPSLLGPRFLYHSEIFLMRSMKSGFKGLLSARIVFIVDSAPPPISMKSVPSGYVVSGRSMCRVWLLNLRLDSYYFNIIETIPVVEVSVRVDEVSVALRLTFTPPHIPFVG